jgi:hypothetical protein
MWAQLVNLCLGLWLMAAPAALGYGGRAAANDHVAGPLAAALAAVAVSEVTRPVRRANVVVGLWLLIAPWALAYASGAATFNSLSVGALLIAFALVRGRVVNRFGGGWSVVWAGRRDGKKI